MDNVALWHERDISHSSVERVIMPDSAILLDTMIARTARLIDGLIVYPENMKKNIELTCGLIFSQKVLLDLVAVGMTREAAYKAVQSAAMSCWKDKTDFIDHLWAEPLIKEKLSRDELEQSFDLTYYLRRVDHIYKSVFSH